MAHKERKDVIEKRYFDSSIRPQDDFYRYVNNGWLKKNKIPASENRWGSFVTLQDTTRKNLRTLLSNIPNTKIRKGSEIAKMHDLYASAMDMKSRNKLGILALKKEIEIIESLENISEISELLAYLHARDVRAPFGLWIDQDDKNSKRMVLRISQAGLGMPDREYYLKKNTETKRIANAYQTYIRKMLALENRYKKNEINNVVKIILKIEQKLAKASMDKVDLRDAHKIYNKYSVSSLKKQYSSIAWDTYFDLLKVPKKARQHVIIDQPVFLDTVNKLLKDVPIHEWKIYLHWHFLDTYSGVLGEDFLLVRFAYYGKSLQGLAKMPELWKRGVGVVNSIMPDALGKLYVEHYFSKKSKKRITALVHNLLEAYRIRIKELDWMSQNTKKYAYRKLETMSLQLGYPKKWETYNKLSVHKKTHAQNILAGTLFHFEKDMRKLAKPTDRNEWFTSVQTVNAYYSPNLNQITFPATILQPPFFYADADDAVNYGAIGSIIGHEITHGFDDSGAKFDEFGNLKNWWTKADKHKFKKKSHILVSQFDSLKVADQIPVNGKLTLGENIADLGGLIIAYKAFMLSQKNKTKKKINNFTPEQRFFISHTQSQRELIRDEFVKFIALNDVHAPTEFRTNIPVSNMEEFYTAFNVKKGDRLYRKSKKRAMIW